MIFSVWAKDNSIAVFNGADFGLTACSERDEFSEHRGIAIAIVKSQMDLCAHPADMGAELMMLGWTFVGTAETLYASLDFILDSIEGTEWPPKWGDGKIAEYLSDDLEFRFKSYVE